MSKITTAKELVEACINATKHKTLYIMGCFGAPMNAANKKRYTANHSYNKQAERTAKINAASADTFGFDCVCLIKGLLWGWNGDASRTYGGASYAENGVPDIGADSMIKVCEEISTDFSKIVPGEAVWMEGHIGVYIGDGLAVECTPRWDDCVQITAVHNIGTKSGYNGRKWTKHGKLPYVTYTEEAKETPAAKLTGEVSSYTKESVQKMYDYLKKLGYSAAGIYGMLGNAYGESACKSNNLQNTGNNKLGMTDEAYTEAVDCGSYTNFAKDSHGYGLFQWTYHTRKAALLAFAQAAKKTIADWQMQLDFADKELREGYKSLRQLLQSTTSIQEASNAFMLQFERPADQSAAAQAKRATYGEKIKELLEDKAEETPKPTTPTTPATPAEPVAELPEVGDIVDFTGATHFISSNAKKGVKCKPGKAKVTARNPGSAHPIHLVKQPGGGSSVYGWVDLADIAAANAPNEIKENSKVKINAGAVYGGLSSARGKAVPGWVCKRTLTVKKIQENKGIKEALLQEINSWVAVASLTAV